MVNPTACHYSAPNRLIEEIGRHPFSGVLGPSGCRSVGSPFTGAGFTTAEAMASAFPSRGMSDPAACLAVRDLGDIQFGCLGPGGEIRGSVAVPVHDQPATIATEGPCPHAICCAALPHLEQVLVEGNQWSHTTRSPPSHAVVYRS